MASHVYHWKHGWIPLDHVALAHGGHPSQAPANVRHGANIKGRRQVAHAVSTIGHIKGDNRAKQTAVAATVTAAHREGATDLVPQAWLDAHGGRAAVRVQAEQSIAAATKAEPRLTTTMHDLAATHGGQLEGLDHRLKGVDSLDRKIGSDAAEQRQTPDLIAAGLFDVNRYTMTVPSDRYAQTAQEALQGLLDQGHTLHKVKNYWTVPDNPYQGINVQVIDPQGAQYELQFHTPESLAVKNGELHRLYEQARVETSDQRVGQLVEQMHQVSRTIPVPPRIAALTPPTRPRASRPTSSRGQDNAAAPATASLARLSPRELQARLERTKDPKIRRAITAELARRRA